MKAELRTKIPRSKVGFNPLREAITTRTGKPHWREVACPVDGCLASPGQNCRKYIVGMVAGKDIGGGYWRIRKTPHDERKDVAKGK